MVKLINELNSKMHINLFYLKIMFLDLHFNIKAYKFTQMPMRVGVLCSEYRTNFEYASKTTTYCHLLIKLR